MREDVGLLLFGAADREYGIELSDVREVDRIAKITRLPGVPAYVEGVVNRHGQLVPVVDLRVRFGMPRVPAAPSARIVVAELRKLPLGIIVDAVGEVVRIPRGQLDTGPDELAPRVARLGERSIAVLDVGRVLAAPFDVEGLAVGAAKDRA